MRFTKGILIRDPGVRGAQPVNLIMIFGYVARHMDRNLADQLQDHCSGVSVEG
jgi:hypothetical protein